jgi:diguanylate cyclase (GGDEF)-like protein/PAS domain S-box-containing protein/hemerythrin-like metal-binding protein
MKKPASSSEIPVSAGLVRAKFQPVLVSALAFLLLLVTGVLLFNSLRTAVKQSVEDDLTSISTLKAEQINEWIDDRYSDAQSVGMDSYFSQGVQRWIDSGGHDDQQRQFMHRQLEAFVAAHHFSSVVLYGRQGEELLQAGAPIQDQAHMRANALHSMASGGVEFIDLHRHTRDVIQLAVGVVCPLKVEGKVVGAIYFIEDASRYLFPLLQQWPVGSETAELQLVRAEGDRVLYLSPLLHRSDAPLSFSLPMTTPDLAAAQALRGSEGMLPHGHDYRNQAVLSFATPIKGTQWVLLAKIDEAEAYALVNRLQVVALFVVLLLSGATGAWFMQWQRRQSLARQADEMNLRLASEARILESEKRFRIVFEQAAFAIARISLDGKFIEVNDAWCAMFGYNRDEASDQRWQSLTHADDIESGERLLRQLLNGEIEHIRVQKRYLRKDGRLIWGSNEVSLVRDAQGAPEYYIAAIQDVTARKQLEDKLESNLILLKMAMDGAREALWEWDLESGEAKFSPEYYTMLGYLPDEFPANQQEWLSRIHPDDRENVFRKIQEELDRHQDLYLTEYRMRTKDGRYRWIQGRGKCIAFDKDGKPLRMVGINMDINERKQMELQVSFLAYHDKLTGLPNRALLFDRFSQALSQAKRDKLHVGLLFADLDGFKQVNDEYGHEAGDAVLKMAAQRLLACVRAADTVVRFGGDEFAVILGNLDDARQAALVADKIIQAFAAEMVLADGILCRVGVSIGISLFPENGTTMDGLLTAADQAMYDSKHSGKNTYSFFGEQLAVDDDQWIKIDESNLLGIFEIDEQHRNLARLLNKLNSAWRHGPSPSVLMELFENLIKATAEHFEAEGRYMAQYGYAELRAHEKEHARLLDEAMRLRERIREGGELLALQTIKDWLLNHIAYSDKPLGKYLLSQGVQ